MNTTLRSSIVLADNRRNDRAFAATLLAMLLAVVLLPFAVPAEPIMPEATVAAAARSDVAQDHVTVLEPVVITGRRARAAELARTEAPVPQI